MANWKFKTPTVEEGPAGGHRLFQFRTLTRGVTIVKIDGEYYQTRYPSQDELDTYEEVYMGGHEYIVDDATKAALIAGEVDVTSANFTAQ